MNDTNGGGQDLRTVNERMIACLEDYKKLDWHNPYAFPNFLESIEREVRRICHAIEDGLITAEYDQAILEEFVTISKKHYHPALPIDQPEAGLQTGKGVYFQIVSEELLNKFLTLLGLQKKG